MSDKPNNPTTRTLISDRDRDDFAENDDSASYRRRKFCLIFVVVGVIILIIVFATLYFRGNFKPSASEWFRDGTSLCYDWQADGEEGQCNASDRLCAPVNEMTPWYRDDTDWRPGGCKMSWGIFSKNAPSWAKEIQLCYQWYADDIPGQCNYGEGKGEVCAPLGQLTSYYRDDTDGRAGGCQMSWMLQVPQNSPSWLLAASLCFNWYGDGNLGQCHNGPGNSSCAQANSWTPYYRDDTDHRDGGCQMSWGIKY